MKKFVVATCIIVAAFAAPNVVDPETSSRRALPALERDETHDARGQYTIHYRTTEGTEVTETGELVLTPDGKAHVVVINGETKYIGTDGKLYFTRYTGGLDRNYEEGTTSSSTGSP